MTPEQFERLLQMLSGILSKQYTIAGAADWPILLILGGALVGVICFMWRDLKMTIRDDRKELKQETDLLWDALKDCQRDCCPRGKGKIE